MLPPGKRAELLGKPLQTVSSSSSETVAVISLGGTSLMQNGMSSAKTSSSGKTGFYSPASTTAGAEVRALCSQKAGHQQTPCSMRDSRDCWVDDEDGPALCCHSEPSTRLSAVQ